MECLTDPLTVETPFQNIACICGQYVSSSIPNYLYTSMPRPSHYHKTLSRRLDETEQNIASQTKWLKSSHGAKILIRKH